MAHHKLSKYHIPFLTVSNFNDADRKQIRYKHLLNDICIHVSKFMTLFKAKEHQTCYIGIIHAVLWLLWCFILMIKYLTLTLGQGNELFLDHEKEIYMRNKRFSILVLRPLMKKKLYMFPGHYCNNERKDILDILRWLFPPKLCGGGVMN